MDIFSKTLNYFKKLDDLKFFIFVFLINAFLVLFVYRSAFLLEFQGDSWQYAWGHKVFYNSTLFSELALRAMRTSLGGGHLTFALIQNNFGLNPLIFYSAAVLLKFLSVIAFYFLAKKLTDNRVAALFGTLILSVSFAGVEATHWVFNMYAHIGLILITLGLYFSLGLAEEFRVRRWAAAFILVCAGIWYATMRTNGILILILGWSFYKFLSLRSLSSRRNLIFWVMGFAGFILVDKFLLGQMEADYSRKYIIDAGIASFLSQISSGKYDFLASPAANLGSVILPDNIWYSFNFPKIFSFLGPSRFKSVIIPSFLIYVLFSGLISWMVGKKENRGFNLGRFFVFFQLGLLWTLIVYLISKTGPVNFSSWEHLLMALFGGYVMAISIAIVTVREIPEKLRELFLITFFWSFVFLLLPGFMNGGPLFGTYHRYMVTTALALPLFAAGLIAICSSFKNKLAITVSLLAVFLFVVAHAKSTREFFDKKARVHNRELSTKIWQQFSAIVPKKQEYIENPPTLYFEASDKQLDSETLFETLYFGFIFRAGLDYHWDINKVAALYNQNMGDLVKDIKKNPKLFDEFYALRMENQSLVNITNEVRDKINSEIQK